VPTLSELNRLQLYSRSPQFMADVEELNAPLNLQRIFSPENRGRVAMLRARVAQALGHSHFSPESIRTLLKQLKAGTRRKGALTHAVKVLPDKTTRGSRGVPGVILPLRDGRFLTLEIDLTAAHKADLLQEVGECISAFQSEQVRSQRQDKRHKTTGDIDMWDVYDQRSNGVTPYKIAREIYRKRTGNVAGFNTDTMEYKAVQRKLKTAQGMINRNPYPRQ